MIKPHGLSPNLNWLLPISKNHASKNPTEARALFNEISHHPLAFRHNGLHRFISQPEHRQNYLRPLDSRSPHRKTLYTHQRLIHIHGQAH